MKQTLSVQNIIGMGFMVFAMFLGAGNLIFPPMVGQLAGGNLWLAAAGFLMTGVGLPLLGVVVISKVGGGFNEISRELPRSLIVLMGSCIFLIIGPLYAVPRTAMVAYEVGIIPFLEQRSYIPRLIFSVGFFAICWYLSMRPGKLLENGWRNYHPGPHYPAGDHGHIAHPHAPRSPGCCTGGVSRQPYADRLP